MGGRYWISGVQIGMLQAYADEGNTEKIKEWLNGIEETQWLGKKEDMKRIGQELQHLTQVFSEMSKYAGWHGVGKNEANDNQVEKEELVNRLR